MPDKVWRLVSIQVLLDSDLIEEWDDARMNVNDTMLEKDRPRDASLLLEQAIKREIKRLRRLAESK